jgi:hypothetical protein
VPQHGRQRRQQRQQRQHGQRDVAARPARGTDCLTGGAAARWPPSAGGQPCRPARSWGGAAQDQVAGPGPADDRGDGTTGPFLVTGISAGSRPVQRAKPAATTPLNWPFSAGDATCTAPAGGPHARAAANSGPGITRT